VLIRIISSMDAPFRISRLPSVQERQAAYLRAHLTLSGEIGLAFRAVRRGCRQSQREYARVRGWSPAHQARLETRAAERQLGHIVRALSPTAFGLLITSDLSSPWSDLGLSVQEIVEWISRAMARQGVTTRALAAECGLSQTTVSRVRDPGRATTVPLGVVADVVQSLGGRLVLAQSTPTGLVPVDPQAWPTAAVLPRSRGNGRRLAAHGWVRRWQPWWYRWDRRPHLGAPPLWSAEAPSEPRWESEPNRNAIAPPMPRPAAAAEEATCTEPHVA
jgi:hypothetical protein